MVEGIEEGEEFPLTTDKQVKAFKFIVKRLRTGSKDKGKLVKQLEDEGIYANHSDCKKFLRNCIKSCNHEIVSFSKRRVGLSSQAKVVN